MPLFLDLPDEILIQTISCLSLRDIHSCQLTCFKLNAIIKGSPEIQYQQALEINGFEDNPDSSHLSPTEKLEKLKRSAKAWRKVKPMFSHTVPITNPTSGIYDLTGGAYLLGGLRRLDLHTLVLPEAEDEDAEPVWKTLTVEESIVDIGVCIDEHDLVVVVTSCVAIPPVLTYPDTEQKQGIQRSIRIQYLPTITPVFHW